MSDPCSQEGRVRSLEASMEMISGNLAELKNTAKETYRLLAEISKQGVEISNLVDSTKRLQQDVDGVMEQVRVMDQTLINHSAFIVQHVADRDQRRSFFTNVFAGVTVAAVIGVASFFFWEMDRTDYHHQGSPKTMTTK